MKSENRSLVTLTYIIPFLGVSPGLISCKHIDTCCEPVPFSVSAGFRCVDRFQASGFSTISAQTRRGCPWIDIPNARYVGDDGRQRSMICGNRVVPYKVSEPHTVSTDHSASYQIYRSLHGPDGPFL